MDKLLSTEYPVPVALPCSGHWRDYLQLSKPGLNAMVMVSVLVGFYMASPGALHWGALIWTMLGAALMASGASALNQYIERAYDARMARTAGRPLPAGRLDPRRGLVFGVFISVLGLLTLVFWVNTLTASLSTLSLLTYIFLYTPLKRVGSVATLVGAISGALPPLLGWTGSGAALDFPAVTLFCVLYLWQIPHFLAIGWKYREQYAAAGFRLISRPDTGGRATAIHALLYACALVPVSMLFTHQGLTGELYMIGAALLGLGLLAFCVLFALHPTTQRARWLFFATIGYLPLLFIFMMLDKVSIPRI